MEQVDLVQDLAGLAGSGGPSKETSQAGEPSMQRSHSNVIDRTNTGGSGSLDPAMASQLAMRPTWSETSPASGASATEAVAHVFAADVGVSLQNETVRPPGGLTINFVLEPQHLSGSAQTACLNVHRSLEP